MLMCGTPCESHVSRGMPTHVVLCQVVPWFSLLLQPGLLPPCLFPPPSVFGTFPAMLGLKSVDSWCIAPTLCLSPWALMILLNVRCCGAQECGLLQLP
jgi:hypothetical protein